MLSLIRALTSKVSFWNELISQFFGSLMTNQTKITKNGFFSFTPKTITLHTPFLAVVLLLLSPLVLAQTTEYTTPNYGTSNYLNNSNESPTQLSIPSASSLIVSVIGETESNYDFIEILDSNQNSFNPSYKFDGGITQNLSINGNTIYVKFTSDGSVTRSGVKVTINTVIKMDYKSPLTLEISTDRYPSETTWEITDALGNKKASGGPYSEKEKLYTETLYLPNGDNYKFTIFDSYGDGICCGYGNGSYFLKDIENQTIISGTETLKSSENKEFNIETPVSQVLSISITVNEDSLATELARVSNNLESLGDWLNATVNNASISATKGTVTTNVGDKIQSIKYKPNLNESGPDSFIIQVKNSKDNTTNITVNVTITPVNDAPVITEGDSKSITMSEDGSPTPFNLTLNAGDVDGNEITWNIFQSAQNGIASVEGTGISKTINYVPTANYHGTDSFVVQISDGELTDTITVNVTIEPVNSAPEFTSTAVNTATQDKPYTEEIITNDIDSDNDKLVIKLLDAPTWLSLSGLSLNVEGKRTATLLGTPKNEHVGSHPVKLQVTDDQGKTGFQEFTITVANVNDAPKFDTNAPSTPENAMTEVYYYHVIKTSDPDTQVVDEKLTISAETSLPSGLKLTNIGNSGTALVDGKPTQIGSFPLKFSVADDEGLAASLEYSFTLEIEKFNRPPVINSVQRGTDSLPINNQAVNISINEDNSLNLTFTASDPDNNDITWSILTEEVFGEVGLNEMTGTQVTLDYTPKLNDNGSESFTVQASDGQAKTALTVNVSITAVNDKPKAYHIVPENTSNVDAATTIKKDFITHEDQMVSGVLFASDPENETLTYHLVSQQEGALITIDEKIGTFTYRPSADFHGKDTFTYKVKDKSSAESNTATVNIKVNPIADTPLVTNDIVTDEFIQTTDGLVISRHADDGDEVTHFKITEIQHGTLYQNDGTTRIKNDQFITFAEGNAGLKFMPQSTPDSDAVNGTFRIQASLSVDDSGLGGDIITATINTNLVNDPPVLNPIGNQTILLGSTLTFTANATDPDVPQQDLIFTLDKVSDVLHPAGASIDPAGNFSWKPTAAGMFQVNVVVTDNGINPPNLTAKERITFEVTQAPILTLPFTEKKVPIDRKFTFTASADHYTNNLTFSLETALTGANITTSGSFTWTPTEEGTFPITIKVTEPDGLSSTETINIEVINNTPPQIEPIVDQIINLGKLFELNVKATDAQNHPFVYQLSSLSAQALKGASIHPSTGKFTWLPIEQGVYTVIVETLETDGLENTARLKTTESFEILVNDQPVVQPIETQIGPINKPLTFTVEATHPQADKYPLQFSVGTGFPGATLNPKTGVFNWTPTQTGDYKGTIRVIETLGNLFTDMPIRIFVKPLGTQLELHLSSHTILTNGTFQVKGDIHPADGKTPVQNLAIQLEIITPQDLLTLTTKTLANGEYEFTNLPIFAKEGQYTFQTRFKGNDRFLESESEAQNLFVRDIVGYSLLVEGQNNDDKDTPTYNKTLNRVYFKMKQQSFKDEDIFYLNYNLSQKERGIGIDDTPSKAAIQESLTTLQTRLNAAPAPFYLVMVDHGGADGSFYLNGDKSKITPTELAQWLDTLEAGLKPAALAKPRVIVLGYCYSGTFIPVLSKSGRTIITTAAADEVSYKGPKEPDGIRSGEFFIESFFHQLSLNHSLKTAFELATDETEHQTLRGDLKIAIENHFQDGAVQHPLLDDDGNQQGSNKLFNNSGDGLVAKDIYLGIQQENDLSNQPPDIVQITNTLYLQADTSVASLFALVNNPGGRIKDNQVIIDIRPPSLKITSNAVEAQGSLEINGLMRQFLPRIETSSTQEGEEMFSASFDVFKELGKYEITYFVEDSQTQTISALKRSLVYKGRVDNNPPTSFSLKSPANQSEPETVLIFDWDISEDLNNDPLTYTLIIGTDSKFNKIVYQDEELSIPMTYLDNQSLIADPLNNGKTGLRDGTQYFWKVLAVDSYGAFTSSETFSFMTNNTNAGPGLGSVDISSGLDFLSVDHAQITFEDLNSIPDIHQVGGISNIILPPGRRRAVIRAEGFEEQTVDFEVTSGLMSKLKVELQPIGDPKPGKIIFNADQALVNEGDGAVDILVERVEGSYGEVSVNYQITSGSAEENNDYNTTNVSGNLTWANQDIALKQIPLALIDDNQPEGTETLTITLSEPTGGAILDGVNPITVTIVDNDEISSLAEPPGSDTLSPTVTIEDTDEIEKTSPEMVSQIEGDKAGFGTLEGQNPSADLDDLANQEPLSTVQFMADRYITHEKIGPLTTFTVVRIGEPIGAISVQYTQTENGTAELAQDYTGGTGTLRWANGDNTPKPISLTVLDDNEAEGPETIELVLQKPSHNLILGTVAQATLIITDDETLPQQEPLESNTQLDTQTEPNTLIQFTNSHYTATEGEGTLEFQVERLGNSQAETSIQYFVMPNGTAIADLDYLGNSFGTLTWAAGENEIKLISLALIDDQLIEGTENVHIVLLDQTNNATLSQMAAFKLTILDNDKPQRLFLPSLGQGITITVDNRTRSEIETDAQKQKAAFRGGASVNGLDYQTQLFMSPTQFVNIVGEIQIDSQHVGQVADILIVVGVLSENGTIELLVMRDTQGEIEVWDGNDMTRLVPALENVTLGETQLLDIYQGLLSQGHLLVFFGYRLQDSGLIVYNGDQPIEVQIQNEVLVPTSALVWQTDQNGVSYATFSPDGSFIVTTSWDQTARIWPVSPVELVETELVETGEISNQSLAILIGHQGIVNHATFNSDGQRLVTTSTDGTAWIWEFLTGKPLAVLKGH